MLVNTTDADAQHRGIRPIRAMAIAAGLLLSAAGLAACGDPTRPLITTGGGAGEKPAVRAAWTGPDGFPNVNVNPVTVDQVPLSPTAVTSAEDRLRADRNRTETEARSAAAGPSQVDALTKLGATHAAAAEAAITTPPPESGDAPPNTPAP